MSLAVATLTGSQIAAAAADLARLRMTVFAAWPYLYDGNEAYEAEYLREFLRAPGAILVAARDGQRIVGAATASPMAAQDAAFRRRFEERGVDVAGLFYFGESVLLPEYRGRGIGHAFFDYREAHARGSGATATCFAAVIRRDDHPDRPADYVPLDAFWRKRGYAPVAGLIAELAWKEHGEAGESTKPMRCWLRRF